MEQSAKEVKAAANLNTFKKLIVAQHANAISVPTLLVLIFMGINFVDFTVFQKIRKNL